MGDISEIERLESIFFPVRKAQAVAQEMSVGAGRKLLQPCHADALSVRIKLLRLCFPKSGALLPDKSRPKNLPDLLTALSVADKPRVQFLPLIVHSGPPTADALRDSAYPGCSCHFPLCECALLFLHRRNARKQSADI